MSTPRREIERENKKARAIKKRAENNDFTPPVNYATGRLARKRRRCRNEHQRRNERDDGVKDEVSLEKEREGERG